MGAIADNKVTIVLSSATDDNDVTSDISYEVFKQTGVAPVDTIPSGSPKLTYQGGVGVTITDVSVGDSVVGDVIKIRGVDTSGLKGAFVEGVILSS